MGVQEVSTEQYCLRRKGGHSLIDYPPVFSPDGQFLLLICGSTVRAYNVRTAECAHVLHPEGGGGERLIAVAFPPSELHNLYGCAEDGRVTVWTWEQGRAVLREKVLQIPSHQQIQTFNILNGNACFITGQFKNSNYLAKYCLKTGVLLAQYDSILVESSKILRVAIGCNNEHQFAVICNGTKFLYVCDLSKSHMERLQNYNGIRIVCVAAHPSEGCVVSGDALGRATVWRGNLLSKGKVVREVLHWHSLPLLAAAFSLQGGYLLSGGMEKVVVKWHLGGLAGSARQMDTMPRLPGAVRFLAVHSAYLAVATTNNSITITTPQLGLVSTIMECGGLSRTTRALGPGLACHRPLAALLLGGRTGHLQLYSTPTDKLLYNVDITGLNSIPATRLNLCPIDTELTCAAVSADGSWLVTSEYRSDGLTYPEERLKFWSGSASSAAASPFALNTCVNLSHGGCRVTSIAINNTGDFCVSAGTDQKFRIWKRDANTLNHKKKVSWSCLTACYYASGVGASLDHNQFKHQVLERSEDDFTAAYLKINNGENDIISRVLGLSNETPLNKHDVGSIRTKEAIEADVELGGVAISQDGSLIAAWFGSKLTLWDSHSCSLRNTLSHPSLRPKGVDVCFGNEDAAHYVVCTTEHCVAVWSLLSLSVRWLVHVRPVTLAADPFSNRMVVATDNNDIFVFTPHQSTPLLSRRAALETRGGVLRHCTFGPSQSTHHFRLYFTRNDSEIYCLEPESATEAPLEQVSRVNLPASNYSALLATKQTSEVRRVDATDTDLAPSALSPQAQFFSAASHMVPSVSLLCSAFLQQLSGCSDPEESVDDVEMISDEGTSSDDEPDPADHHSRLAARKVEFWRPNYEQTKEKRMKKILKEPGLQEDLTKNLLD